MSFNTTIDDVVYQQTTQPENIAEKPFIQKEWSNPIFDTNTSANYASNQVIFDTTTLSNSGVLVNYEEGVIILPMVEKIVCSGANDWTNNNLVKTDFVLGFKNSHVQLIHSIAITLNNINIVQAVPLTNAYLTFIQHSELSSDDEYLNGPLTGYAKDTSTSWYYNTPTVAGNILTGDSRGVGLGNNCNFKTLENLECNESSNEGLLKRQKFVNKYNTEKVSVLGNGYAQSQSSLKSYVANTPEAKYIYYDAVLRLKDICPNLFKNFPMAMGIKLKITLTLNNNISFRFQKLADGNFAYDKSSFQNVTSQTNPLMIAASFNPIMSSTADGVIDVSTYDHVNIPCGTATLPCSDANWYTVSMRIGKNGTTDLSQSQRPQCVLYVPSYRMSPKFELEYFSQSNRIRKIHYTELEYQMFSGSQSFALELSTSCIRPKRLILIPFLNASQNFGLDPLSSPFTTEPATTSPCILKNFNCQISNMNIFPNDISYSYDHYLQELNGQYGINANLVNGLVSSRINLVDFENNYNYIVCDLSRRLPEQDLVAVSIRVRGTVDSVLKPDFHAFIEKECVIEIDVMTGALIQRY